MRGLYQKLINFNVFYLFSLVDVEKEDKQDFDIRDITSSEFRIINKKYAKITLRFKKNSNISKLLLDKNITYIKFYFYNVKIQDLVIHKLKPYKIINKGSHIEVTFICNGDDIDAILSRKI